MTTWLEERDALQAIADNKDLPLEVRIQALTELFFHCGQDRHSAAKAVRQIQDLVRAA